MPKAKNMGRAIFTIVALLPPLVITIAFLAVPAIRAFFLSFTDANALGIGGVDFIGLENYRYMFSDQVFIKAFVNTLVLLVAVPVVTIAVSLVLAEILNRSGLKEAAFYRTVFFFPSIISLTVVAIVWSFIFHPTLGLVNTMLDALHLSALKHSWLGDASTALVSVGFTLVWQAAGYYMVMLLAAISSISRDYYEAATIDGASAIRQFFCITLPEISGIIIITLILSMSGTLNLSFTLTTIMTNGGPNNASLVLLKYIYNQGMTNGNFGYAMAMTVFTLGFTIILSIVVQKVQRRAEG